MATTSSSIVLTGNPTIDDKFRILQLTTGTWDVNARKHKSFLDIRPTQLGALYELDYTGEIASHKGPHLGAYIGAQDARKQGMMRERKTYTFLEDDNGIILAHTAFSENMLPFYRTGEHAYNPTDITKITIQTTCRKILPGDQEMKTAKKLLELYARIRAG